MGFTAVSAFIGIDPLGRLSWETWRCSFRSHKLKISTFSINAYKTAKLFNFCDRWQQIFNNIDCVDKGGRGTVFS
ncbi:hypothetical protein CJP72_19455 [Citrobacter sp. NCU1]|nr:hypothetical protein [Citrobacter sp. NCU1]